MFEQMFKGQPRVNATGDWGYFNIWWPEASHCRTRDYEEECRKFIEDAIREKIERNLTKY